MGQYMRISRGMKAGVDMLGRKTAVFKAVRIVFYLLHSV